MNPLGLSLPVDYLADVPASPESTILRGAFRCAERGLADFRRLGVSAIELRRIAPTTPADLVERAADAVRRAGMSIAVHGFLPEGSAAEAIETVYPWVTTLRTRFRRLQWSVVIVVHAFAASSGSVDELRERTVLALRHLARQGSDRDPRLHFALELNRQKPTPDPSATWEGVTLMCREIAHEGVGICWDWGHGYANARGGFGSLEPPQSFLRRVIHAHVHDVGGSGETHWPLSGNGTPVHRFVSMLHRAGYGGLFVLELSPTRFHGHLPVRPKYEESLRILKDAIDQAVAGQ